MLRRLYPPPPSGRIDDLVELFGNDARPALEARPWVLVNMIASVDGAISVGGRSGRLGGPVDKAAFLALRSVPDVVLVGSGTVTAERYGPVRLDEAARVARVGREQSEVPRLAIVSASLRLDPELPLFGGPRPIVITTADADPARREAIAAVADLIEVGSGRVDLDAALRELHTQGHGTVLCEGGPTLNGSLLEAGLIDELAVTLSPTLVGDAGPGLIAGATPDLRALQLERVLEADDFLLCRYLVRR